MRPIIKECRLLARSYDVKVRFVKLSKNISAEAEYENGLIKINSLCKTRQEILSAFFHELAHIKCFRYGLWKNYHYGQDLARLMKIALKVERWADRNAEHELYDYDKRLKYIPAYNGNNQELLEFLKSYYKIS